MVSIFVNPAQFAPHEDFDRYPRDLDSRCSRSSPAMPISSSRPRWDEMYPDGFATSITVGGPSEGLETDFRPHFFSGVATIVAKLLIAVAPDVAVFGEKDWQQLQVIKRLVADLALPVEIVGAPILREPDGLAMSSRNAYLKPREREIAGKMNVVLRNVIERDARQGPYRCRRELCKDHAAESRISIPSITSRSAMHRPWRLSPTSPALPASSQLQKIGGTRLIDNMAV